MKTPALFLALALAMLILPACTPAPAVTEEPQPIFSPTVTPSPSPTIDWFPATATRTPQPTTPPPPTPDPFTGVGEELFRDRFRDTSFFTTFRNSQGSAGYGNDELTLAVRTGEAVVSSLRKSPLLSDFYLEVLAEPSLCRGQDAFGILFRATSEWSTYRYILSCDGQLRLERVRGGQVYPLVDWTPSDQFYNLGVTETKLALVAVGDEFRFYVNGAFQFSMRDPIFSEGQIGLFARSNGESALTVNFHELVVREVDAAAARSTATPTITPRPSATRMPSPTSAP